MFRIRYLLAVATTALALTAALAPATQAGPGGNTLHPGESLGPGQFLQSANKMYKLVLQQDSNLVLYNMAGGALWASYTDGKYASQAVMQTDGNFVIYGSYIVSGHPNALWNSHTSGRPGAALVLQDDGNLVIYANVARWDTHTAGAFSAYWLGTPPAAPDVLRPGQSLRPGQFLRSADWRFQLILQQDGNLVLYNVGGSALWASGTNGQAVSQAVMQTDGNFVIYGYPNALFNTHTNGDAGAYLTVQNDGNVVIYQPNVLWDTCTSQ